MLSELAENITSTFSVFIPIIGTVVAGLVLYAKQDYDHVQNMRRAFLAELNAVDLPTYVDSGDRKLPLPYSSRLVPTTVYENNADQIGKLTPEEVDSVVDFYTLATHPEHLKEVMDELELFVEDPRWDLMTLDEKRERAVEDLEEGLGTGFWKFLLRKLT